MFSLYGCTFKSSQGRKLFHTSLLKHTYPALLSSLLHSADHRKIIKESQRSAWQPSPPSHQQKPWAFGRNTMNLQHPQSIRQPELRTVTEASRLRTWESGSRPEPESRPQSTRRMFEVPNTLSREHLPVSVSRILDTTRSLCRYLETPISNTDVESQIPSRTIQTTRSDRSRPTSLAPLSNEHSSTSNTDPSKLRYELEAQRLHNDKIRRDQHFIASSIEM